MPGGVAGVQPRMAAPYADWRFGPQIVSLVPAIFRGREEHEEVVVHARSIGGGVLADEPDISQVDSPSVTGNTVRDGTVNKGDVS